MDDVKKQGMEILSDKRQDGKERPWRKHKMQNECLSEIYEEVSGGKAARLRDCSTWLTYTVDGESGRKQLARANFCRVRLCPVCTWRRSLKIKGQGEHILQAMEAEYPYAYILVTLTVRNVTGAELSHTIDAMGAAWNRLMKFKAVRDILGRSVEGGWHRSMEITHNVDIASASYDTYHPHYHVLMAVPQSYFTGKTYISHEKWVALWRKAMRLDYDPSVDVRRAYTRRNRTLAEAIKYGAKPGEYIIPDDWDLSVDTVRILDAALNHRRFSAWGGVMKRWHKKLHLDDAEDGDLVHTDPQDETEKGRHEITYWWYSGYRQYVRGEG